MPCSQYPDAIGCHYTYMSSRQRTYACVVACACGLSFLSGCGGESRLSEVQKKMKAGYREAFAASQQQTNPFTPMDRDHLAFVSAKCTKNSDVDFVCTVEESSERDMPGTISYRVHYHDRCIFATTDSYPYAPELRHFEACSATWTGS